MMRMKVDQPILLLKMWLIFFYYWLVPHDNVTVVLDDLETKLSQILIAHLEEIRTLRESTIKGDALTGG